MGRSWETNETEANSPAEAVNKTNLLSICTAAMLASCSVPQVDRVKQENVSVLDFSHFAEDIFDKRLGQKTQDSSSSSPPPGPVEHLHNKSPWSQTTAPETVRPSQTPWTTADSLKPELPALPFPDQQKQKPLDQISLPYRPPERVATLPPIYTDASARAGNIELTQVTGDSASKIISTVPNLFRAEGMRELRMLTEPDSSKAQFYVSQNPTEFKKENPNLTVYGSIQEACDKAAAGSVINVMPGKITSRHPKGEPYTESVSVRRSDLVIKTNEKMPAAIQRGGFSIGSGIHDVKILNFDISEFSGRESAIRIQGGDIRDIVIGGNYFYSATGSEAVGFYGTNPKASSSVRNLYLIANVIGQDRDGNDKPLNIGAKQLEATPFNGNISDIVAVGNLYFGTRDLPLNLGMDFIGGENLMEANGEVNKARNGFVAYNYSRQIGHSSRWASGVAYIDGAAKITEVLNMSDSANMCGEIGAERPSTTAYDNTFNGNICKDNKNNWIAVGAPDDNGASVKNSRIQNNIVISKGFEPNVQYNAGITRQEINSKNFRFDDSSKVNLLPRKIVELYQFHYGSR